MKRSLLIGLCFAAAAANGRGVPLTAENATNAIVGEAAGCPYVVKLGVAAAIRNRGTLKGVYGFNAKHNASEPARIWTDAARAWSQSATNDPTLGANHFGCRADVAKGTFKGLKLTAVLGSGKHATYFFK